MLSFTGHHSPSVVPQQYEAVTTVRINMAPNFVGTTENKAARAPKLVEALHDSAIGSIWRFQILFVIWRR